MFDSNTGRIEKYESNDKPVKGLCLDCVLHCDSVVIIFFAEAEKKSYQKSVTRTGSEEGCEISRLVTKEHPFFIQRLPEYTYLNLFSPFQNALQAPLFL